MTDKATDDRSAAAIDIFYSYAHEDETYREQLEKHLSILKRHGVIRDWHDRKIGAGTEWQNAIDDRMKSARIILLLVSSDFLASDYCHDIEMTQAMKRHEEGTARVIPIILRDCDWSRALFSKLQALPRDAKAIKLWSDIDSAFTDVAKGIRKAVEELSSHP